MFKNLINKIDATIVADEKKVAKFDARYESGCEKFRKGTEKIKEGVGLYKSGACDFYEAAKVTPDKVFSFFFGSEEKTVVKPAGERRVAIQATLKEDLELAKYEKLAKEKAYRLLCDEVGKGLCYLAEWGATGKTLRSVKTALFPIAEARVAAFENMMLTSEFEEDRKFLEKFRNNVIGQASCIAALKHLQEDGLDVEKWKEKNDDEWYQLYVETYFSALKVF